MFNIETIRGDAITIYSLEQSNLLTKRERQRKAQKKEEKTKEKVGIGKENRRSQSQSERGSEHG